MTFESEEIFNDCLSDGFWGDLSFSVRGDRLSPGFGRDGLFVDCRSDSLRVALAFLVPHSLHPCGIDCRAIAAKIRASIVRQPHEGQSLFNTGSKSQREARIPSAVDITMNPAAQILPNLTGKTLSEALTILAAQGFKFKTSTAGGYESFEHPDGSIIHIKPTGEVVRTGPKICGTSGKYCRRRYNQHGEQIEFIPGANTHSTGENLSL
jgi:hypothetical protein